MDVYTLVAERIISEFDQGIVPWHKPWTGGTGAIDYTTGKPYSLLNQILLGGRCGEYLTFQQARKEGGHVRKGKKGSMIVFFKFPESVDEDTGEVKSVPYLRHITVFHTDQCEGIAPRYRSSLPFSAGATPADSFAEQIIADYVSRSGIHLIHRQSTEAFYRPPMKWCCRCAVSSARHRSITNESKQDINLQIKELQTAGAEKVIFEYEHGNAQTKKSLQMLLDTAHAGDTIITLEVSRLSRSTKQLCEIIEVIKAKRLRLVIMGNITVDCRTGGINPMSQAFIQMSAVFAELELSIIRARGTQWHAECQGKRQKGR